MTADQDLSARLAGLHVNDPVGLFFLQALTDAYVSGQLITIADHLAAVQAAVAKAVEAEREAIVDMFHPEQLTVWSSEILGDLSTEGVLDIQEYGEKVVAYDIVARNLQAIAAAIRSRGVAG